MGREAAVQNKNSWKVYGGRSRHKVSYHWTWRPLCLWLYVRRKGNTQNCASISFQCQRPSPGILFYHILCCSFLPQVGLQKQALLVHSIWAIELNTTKWLFYSSFKRPCTNKSLINLPKLSWKYVCMLRACTDQLYLYSIRFKVKYMLCVPLGMPNKCLFVHAGACIILLQSTNGGWFANFRDHLYSLFTPMSCLFCNDGHKWK